REIILPPTGHVPQPSCYHPPEHRIEQHGASQAGRNILAHPPGNSTGHQPGEQDGSNNADDFDGERTDTHHGVPAAFKRLRNSLALISPTIRRSRRSLPSRSEESRVGNECRARWT